MAQQEGSDPSDKTSGDSDSSGYRFDLSCLKSKFGKVTECLRDADNVSQQTCEEVISSAVVKIAEIAMPGQDHGAVRKRIGRRMSKALTQILSNKSILKRLTGRKSTQKIKKLLDSLHRSFSQLQTKLASAESVGKDQCKSADLESRVLQLEKKTLGLRETALLAFKVLQEAE